MTTAYPVGAELFFLIFPFGNACCARFLLSQKHRRSLRILREPRRWLTPLRLNKKGAWKAPFLINRTRQGPIHTESLLPVQIKIPLNETVPVCQKLATKIKEHKALGMSNEEISLKLKINRKTVGKGLVFQN